MQMICTARDEKQSHLFQLIQPQQFNYTPACAVLKSVNEPAYPATNTASDAIALNELASQIIKFPGCLEPLWANLYAGLVAHAELCSQQRK